MNKRCVALTILALSLGAKAASSDISQVEIESAYQDNSGHLLVKFKSKDEVLDRTQLAAPITSDNLTYYGTIRGLQHLQETEVSGTTAKATIKFYDAHFTPAKVDVATESASVACGSRTKNDFKQVTGAALAQVQNAIRTGQVPFDEKPVDARKPIALFKQRDGTLVYVDSSAYVDDESHYRVLTGKPGAMTEKKIKFVQVYDDKSATYIRTADGEMLAMPDSKSTTQPSWNSASLQRVSLEQFDIRSLYPSHEDSSRLSPCDGATTPSGRNHSATARTSR